ncbi:MAG: NDP-sugar dehydrogenase [Alcanivoracaceae bacterium]|nr:NDP-sugar dehydrogenase [Alcanivoracaceae bacterium]|tara:strand:- start:2569 stop:3852 length:1284 start_codon:yes stop_codon:yes gene_type:complete
MQISVYGDTLCAQVTATALAQTGHDVYWYVTDMGAWNALEQGAAIYKEPGLRFLLEEQRRSGRLRYRLYSESKRLNDSRVVFLAVQPGKVSLLESIVAHHAAMPAFELAVTQTVCAVGTSERLRDGLVDSGSRAELAVMPDMTQAGRAYDAFTRPDCILIGHENEEARVLLCEIMRPYVRTRDTFRHMSLREAEFARLASSGILATRISFMNEMAQLAERVDVDISVIREALAADSRIGSAYLYPGCGFGGPGLSGDVMSLVDTLQGYDAHAGLLEQVLAINERQKEVLFRKFWQYYGGNVVGKRVVIWGAAFKPGTHRVENSPALKVIEALWAQGVQVAVHDPLALPELSRWADGRGDLELYKDQYMAAADADALMLFTEWKQYWSPEWARLRGELREPLILDGRNIYDPVFVRSQGFQYKGVGRI